MILEITCCFTSCAATGNASNSKIDNVSNDLIMLSIYYLSQSKCMKKSSNKQPGYIYFNQWPHLLHQHPDYSDQWIIKFPSSEEIMILLLILWREK